LATTLDLRGFQNLKGEHALVWFHLSAVRGADACQPAAFIPIIFHSKQQKESRDMNMAVL